MWVNSVQTFLQVIYFYNLFVWFAGGADVNAKDEQGRSPLHWAAQTPLDLSIRKGRRDTAELLIANGADVNARNKWGQTPLHTAARNGHKEVGKILIARGVDINAKDNEGRTPLWWAKYRGRNETVELLRKHGAKESRYIGNGAGSSEEVSCSEQVIVYLSLASDGKYPTPSPLLSMKMRKQQNNFKQ